MKSKYEFFDKQYIICASIFFNTNKKHIHQPKNIKKGFVISGRRHHNCFNSFSDFGLRFPDIEYKGKVICGFITSDNKFVTRKQGYAIAVNCGQIEEKKDKGIRLNFVDKNGISEDHTYTPILASEDLY